MAKKKTKIGDMRWEITIEQVTRTEDADTGAWDETWATYRTTRAKREYVAAGSGEDIEDDLQLLGVQKRFYTIRKLDSSINVSDFRVNDGGVMMDILEVQQFDFGERYIKLICVERNNDNS